MENTDMNELDVYMEGNYFAFDIWKRSYEIFSNQFAKKLFYKRIIAIENKGLSLLESCKELCAIYKKSLERFIGLYDKDKLLVSLFFIKEYLTKNMTKSHNRLKFITDERDSINFLIYMVYHLKNQDRGGPLTEKDAEGYTYLGDIFIYAKCYSLLTANMERIEDAPEEMTLCDMAFSTVETECFHEYYNAFEKSGDGEKFEDYEISDLNIKAQVERMEISLSKIKQKSDQCISKVFGFHLDKLKMLLKMIARFIIEDESGLYRYIEDDNEDARVILMPKQYLYEIAQWQNINDGEIDKIIKYFSIDQKEEMAIELSCFYVTEKNICFGICDMMQTFSMFEKFALSGAHLQYYIKNNKYMELLHPSQKAMSSYLCFVMADVLLKNGYKLPKESFKYKSKKYTAPRVEMKKILDGKTNILGNSGDCDVLFLSEYSAHIICVEFKYFVPSITYEELKKTDRNKITKQIYGKLTQIQNRENALKNNLEFLIRYLGGTQQNYNVKTMIVLARPNMYVYSDEIKQRIPYEFMTMNEFLNRVEEHFI